MIEEIVFRREIKVYIYMCLYARYLDSKRVEIIKRFVEQ